jgi:hypothetical protein
MMLTKRDRNKIYEAIDLYGLDPARFNLEDTGDKVVITHNSGSTFEFTCKNKRFPDRAYDLDRYQVKAFVPEGIDQASNAATIDYLTVVDIPNWLEAIRLTVDTPDYWAEIQRGRELLTNIDQTDSANTPFTEDEQKHISAQLREIKEQLKEESGLSLEQVERIEEKLDDAAEASMRLGRKDWLIYFLGTITALIITATVSAGVGEHIFTLVIHALAHLFTGGSEPLQIPL